MMRKGRRLLLWLLLLALLFWSSRARIGPENYTTRLLQKHGAKLVDFRTDIREEGLYYTQLDASLRHMLVQLRNLTQQAVLSQFDWIRELNLELGRMQEPVLASERFPCDLSAARSPEPPRHISQLRPGDIDIVATCGDSANSGTGILGLSELDAYVEYRGYAYTGGGFESWRTALTLPNILRLYNSRLYGFAEGHSLGSDANVSHFNLAEPMLTLHDMPFQAHVLVERMRRDPLVNMQEHWKLLNIQVGTNDICSELCNWPDPEDYLRITEQQLLETFRILRAEVPRLLINFIVIQDIDEIFRLLDRVPARCTSRVPYFCTCYHLYKDPIYYKAAKRLRQLQISVAERAEFRSDDFAIVTHGILGNLSRLWSQQGLMDRRFFARDCIHYSQLGHAVLAKQLWNSLFRPADLVTTEPWREPFKGFECPSRDRPYLRTVGDILQ